MKGREVVHSSKKTGGKDTWRTPREVFDHFDEIAGGFNLDLAASAENALCDEFFTEEEDALLHDWDLFGRDTRAWCNPPYSRMREFVAEAHQQASKVDSIWLLIASRTDTKAWHDHVMRSARVYLLKGRIKFVGAEHGAPFPSAVVVFDGVNTNPEFISLPVAEFYKQKAAA